MAYRRKVPPVENPFVKRHVERMVGTGKPPKVDPDRLPNLGGSKPSPARAPTAGRVDAMAARARQRKTAAFVEKKRLQRATREEAQDHE